MSRLAQGGSIDRQRPLHFVFDGRRLSGFAGDTLASALLANGVNLVGRSFKLHRPRGIMAAGVEEANAFVAVGEGAQLDTNLRATQVELYDGLIAASLNRWPSLSFDIGAVAGTLARFLPAGFYYKTFMWPDWRWFEGWIRRRAGLGRSATQADPDRYEHAHAHCDVLIVGGGPAGLMAALAAAASGAEVMLCEQEPDFGGTLQWQEALIAGKPALAWVLDVCRELHQNPRVKLLPRTTVAGYYDRNSLVALERVADHLPPVARNDVIRQRLWKIEARQVVLATGALERPMVFPDNDRPGILLLSAALRYLRQYAVVPRKNMVAFVNHDAAYADLGAVIRTGVNIPAIVDTRPAASAQALAIAEAAHVPVIFSSCIARVRGAHTVRAVQVARLDGTHRHDIACEGILTSGGWNPVVHLFSQSGGTLCYDEELTCFVPQRSVQAERSAGAARGIFTVENILRDGMQGGQGAAAASGYAAAEVVVPQVAAHEVDFAIQPFWAVPTELAGEAKQWIDFHNDVTTQEVAVAVRENFVAVEHLKRYTTLGMALDQGKTSNVNGLAVLGQLTGRTPDAVGTTKFRPPYTPLTFNAIAGTRRGRWFQPLRQLPLHEALVDLGALMEDYGGWLRPVCVPRSGETEAQAIAREVLAVRTGAGITDYSSLGKIEVKGPDAECFLNKMLFTDVTTLKSGRCRYNLMLNENGVVIDDGIVSRLGADHFLVGTTSGAARRIVASFEEWLQCEWPQLQVFVADVTSHWGVVLLTGPGAREFASQIGSDIDFSAAGFPHMTVRQGHLGQAPVRVHRVSFSGEISYEIAVPAGFVPALWQRLRALGAQSALTVFGMESLLLLRLEKGFLHVGTDTDGTTLPHDIGFRVPAGKKSVDFIGWRSLLRTDSLRTDRLQLVGLTALDERRPLPIGGHLFAGSVSRLPAATEGYVTSSAISPTLQRPVALGLLKGGAQRLGEKIRVFGRGDWHEAQVSAPCFYDAQGEKIHA